MSSSEKEETAVCDLTDNVFCPEWKLRMEYSLFPKSSACIVCPAGTFSPATNSSECTKCNIGEFSPTTLSKECFSCARGWATNTTASSVCQQCAERYRSDVRPEPGLGSGLCLPCLRGEVQPPDRWVFCLRVVQ